MTERELFNRLRKLSANRQHGPALVAKLDEIEDVVKQLRAINKGSTRKKTGGRNRMETGGEDRSE